MSDILCLYGPVCISWRRRCWEIPVWRIWRKVTSSSFRDGASTSVTSPMSQLGKAVKAKHLNDCLISQKRDRAHPASDSYLSPVINLVLRSRVLSSWSRAPWQSVVTDREQILFPDLIWLMSGQLYSPCVFCSVAMSGPTVFNLSTLCV